MNEARPPASPKTTQAWLQKIYARPQQYLGHTIAILNDEQIVAIASTFREARDAVAKLDVPAGAVTYFRVPHSLPDVCIPTLRLRSLKESLWLPLYPVELRGPQAAIPRCEMLVDSGADISLLSLNVGAELGLSRSDEEELLTAQGVGGVVGYCLRRIEMSIDGRSLRASVAWCQDTAIEETILGRKDVFDMFFIEFRQSERRVLFKPGS